MGVFIKKPEAEARSASSAARTGETLTEAIERAVDERLAELGPPPQRYGRVDRQEARRGAAPISIRCHDQRHGLANDEIIGYDDYGVPNDRVDRVADGSPSCAAKLE